MAKINYIIPTWVGPRRAPNSNYLKDHLLRLLTLKHDLVQITIVKPTIVSDENYYDIDSLLDLFECKVVMLEKHDNLGQSYGQLFYAYETYKDAFDYYIFVEDDYMPDIDNFDTLLVNEYLEQNVDGYLCSYAGDSPSYPRGGCSISNGIMSTKYFEKVYNFFDNPIETVNGNEGYMCHQNFANILRDSGFEFKDFSHKYRVPYYGHKIIEYGRTDTDKALITPHQLYRSNVSFRRMTVDDLDWFLNIRNEAREYLHNNSEFTYNDAIEWFKLTDRPSYYVIKLGHRKIGYFRTSDVEGSLYIGCDLHKNYRGLGLAYKAYLEFINHIETYYKLQEIKLEVLSANIRAINLYKKLGFKQIGIADDKINRNGTIVDSIIMKLDR